MKRILTLLFLLPLFAAGQCDTVTGLTATDVGHASATISFTAPSASLYFVLIYNGTRQFRNYPGGTYPALVIAPLVNLTPSTAYTYTIVRYCSGSDSAESSDYYFTTTAPPCDTVTNVAASVTSNSVSITSTAAAYGDSYVIYYVRDGQTDTTTEAGADEDFQLANLRTNTVYWYQIGTICGSDTTRNTRRSFTTSNSPAYTPSYNFGWQYKRLAADSTLNIPTMSAASLKNGKNDKAAFIYDTVYGAPAVFDPLTQTWDYLSTQDSSIVVVATVAALSAYSGNASTVIVTDSLRGGFFNYYSSGLTTDNGIIFSATGKGGGFWKRDVTEENAILTDWFDIKPDGTNQTTKVIAALNAAQTGKIKTLKFGIGTYQFDTVRVTSPGIVITGHGDSTILKKLTGTIGRSGFIQIAASYCRVENITLNDNGIKVKMLSANHGLAGVDPTFQMVGFRATGVKIYATNRYSAGIFVGRFLDAIISDCYLVNRAATYADNTTLGIAFYSSDADGESSNIIIRNNTVIGFYNGIDSYGTGQRYEVLIDGNIVTDAQRYGITAYHAVRSRVVNNRCDRNEVGIWSDSGDEPERQDSGYNTGYGNIVANNQCFKNSLYGFKTEQFRGGSFTGNTADSNYIGFLFSGGTGSSTIAGNVGTRNLKYNYLFEKSAAPIEYYLEDINFSGNVAKLAGEHGVKFTGIQRGLIISSNIITDNGTLSKADTTLHYAGIWIGMDDGPNGTTPEAGTKARGAIITNNVIGDSIEIAEGTAGNGYQYYGIYLQDTGITGKVYIANNQFESDKPYHIVANNNRVTLSGNFFSGTAKIEYDTTISTTVLNYGYKDGEIDYANDSSLTLPGEYNQTHFIMRGTHIWMDNNDRIRYNKNYPTNNTDGYLVLDSRDSSFTCGSSFVDIDGNVQDNASLDSALATKIMGMGIAQRMAFWNGTNSLSSGASIFIDSANNRIGLLTNAPTHTLTFAQGNTGIVNYNTIDQVTNYERFSSYWNSNVWTMATDAGGTGTNRPIAFSANGSVFTMGNPSKGFEFSSNGANIGSIVNIGSSTGNALTGSSGVQSGLQIDPTVSQTGTAGYNGLYISPFENSTGSGNKLLIDAGTNSAAQNGGTHTSKFSVDNAGNVVINNTATAGFRMFNTSDRVTNYERAVFAYNANVLELGTEFGGTGSTRSFRIGIGSSAGSPIANGRNILIQGSAPIFQFTHGSTGITGNLTSMIGTYQASTGTQSMFTINPTINQSGTASYEALAVNVTETSTGSGSKTLFRVSTGGTSRFSIDNGGVVVATAPIVLNNTTGNGYLQVVNGTTPSAPTSAIRLFSSAGGLSFVNSSGDVASIYASTGTATFTIPAGTNTAATLTGAQVLTNKTISGASNTLGDIPSTALTTPAARGYALQATHGSSNYAASTVYYFGNMGGNITTVAQRNKIYIPANGTIKKAYVSYFVGGTLASTEAITFAIRHNNTTDYTISNTATLDAAIVDFNSTSLNIAVAAGDFIEMKVTTPAFATAPTTVRCSVVLFIE